MKYNLVANGDDSNITVFHDGEMYCANNQHPSWDEIVRGVLAGDASVLELFEVGRAADKKFRRVSERVSYKNGRLYFDGEEIDNALTQQIIRFLETGTEDFMPLVNFMEKVATNPEQHSREQLYRWLTKHEFSITEDGDIIGYKGVRRQDDGVYNSTHSGKAIVNGEEITGYIPNSAGDTVEMPRGEVNHDPRTGCSTGLHVANWAYASGYGNAVLAVLVNPRDVVSVPTEANDQKVRCCRYTVIGEVTEPWQEPIVLDYWTADVYA